MRLLNSNVIVSRPYLPVTENNTRILISLSRYEMVFYNKTISNYIVVGFRMTQVFVFLPKPKDEADNIFITDEGLRGPDWKYGESLARLGKSKILIIGLNDTYGELSSKIILKVSGNLYFSRKSRKTKIRVLLINYAKITLKIGQVQYACIQTFRIIRKQD